MFVFVFNFFNRFLFPCFSFVLVFTFFVLVLVFFNEFIIFSFFVIFVFVNENHTVAKRYTNRHSLLLHPKFSDFSSSFHIDVLYFCSLSYCYRDLLMSVSHSVCVCVCSGKGGRGRSVWPRLLRPGKPTSGVHAGSSAPVRCPDPAVGTACVLGGSEEE